MVDIAKIDMSNIWASSGDKTMPDVSKIAQGWIVETVPRQTWNWFENRQDQNIAYMLQKGIPEWDAATEYQANKSYVQRLGVIYKALLTGVNQDPNSATTYWTKAFVESTAYVEAIKSLGVTANTTSYINSAGVAANAAISAFVVGILSSASNTAFRTAIGAQALSANLTSLSGVTAGTNVLPYFDTATSMTTTPITAVGRALLGAVDVPSQRLSLGLGTVATMTTGTVAGTVAAGNDSRILGALQNTNNLSDLPSIGTARSNLGLGNAATATLTTSASDTTTGRVLKVGDFGVGGSGIVVGDINALTLTSATGTYKLATPFTGAPVAGNPFNVVHQMYDNQMTQYASLEGVVSPRYFMRKYSAGAWQAWVEFYHSANSSALVAQVQANVQPILDTKVNRAGDTFTGPVYNTSTTVGFQAVSTAPKFEMQKPNVLAGMWWINAANKFAFSTTAGDGNAAADLLTMDGAGNLVVTGAVTTPTLNVTNNGTVGTLTVANTITSAGAIVSNGNIAAKGGVLAAYAVSASANAHTYYYNVDGTVRGITYVDSASSYHIQIAGVERAIFTAAGQITFYGPVSCNSTISATTALYAGASFHDTNGNIYGPTWSGYLSTYLTNNFVQGGASFRANAAAYLTTGQIGSFAFLGNTSGTNVSPGGYLSSGLSYGSSNSNAGGTAAGTWQACGYGTNGGFTVWLRVA